MQDSDELLPEYDLDTLKNAVKGKYTRQKNQVVHTVTIEPDVAPFFPTDAAVNEALRRLLRDENKVPVKV